MARAIRRRNARIRGLPPVARRDARILVLGSMPGIASLRAREYYAHPRNGFWRIAGAICGFDPRSSYSRRKAALISSRIAVWDVVATCFRSGSLDSGIDDRSIVVNPFAKFLAAHRGITRVCFNGRKAEATWHRYVLKALPVGRDLEYCLLPSTSPANAGMSYLRKLEIWRGGLAC